MRSHTFLRRSRTLLRPSTASDRFSRIPTRPYKLSKREPNARTSTRVFQRLSSSGIPPIPDEPSNPPAEEPRELPKRTRASTSSKDSSSNAQAQLPSGLNVLWTPDVDSSPPFPFDATALPPPEIFDEVLQTLYVILHQQTQRQAVRTSNANPAVEPTLALYCPIEGGDYVIDHTIYELARRTGSEVLVIDTAHLAAGEWGHFGKAASSLEFPRNPLHFSSSSNGKNVAPPESFATEIDDADMPFASPTQMTLHIMAPPSGRGRAIVASTPRTAPSKIQAFFDSLVNLPSTQANKPRLVYIRDFPTLASFTASWYPHLLTAVCNRRQGPLPSTNEPITHPMTIIFGTTPPITTPYSSSDGQPGTMRFLMNRNQIPSTSPSRVKGKLEWSEDETAERAREKRLRERLKRWERGGINLQDEIVSVSGQRADADSDASRPNVVVIDGPDRLGNLAKQFTSMAVGEPPGIGMPDKVLGRFFRSSYLVPSLRSLIREKECRMGRRRQINELTMRMGVGDVGGQLTGTAQPSEDLGDELRTSASNDSEKMWDEWGKSIVSWGSVRRIADRVVGGVVATYRNKLTGTTVTQPISVPWSAVYRAWNDHQSSRQLRKAWIKESSSNSSREQEDEGEGDEVDATDAAGIDEVVERVKQDSELDDYEHRLLSCIVNPASMPTSFSHVHLPAHTIDSVRTIVSLPLLHPAAFQQGILKDHGLTGCLLFGPPGTGKTLVVRALAKEAGCRMMVVSPSDVMDMFVGEGEKLVKAVFSLARRLSPCVIFLDEIDALFGARMSTRESGGAIASRGVITEFMQEMDGLRSSRKDNVIVIGATNRPFDLDDAVLRRLPRRLLVDLPGEKEREEILKILLREEQLNGDLDLKVLAKLTESFSGSDLKHLCVSAALDAVKEHIVLPWNISPSNEPPAEESSAVIESPDCSSSPLIVELEGTPEREPENETYQPTMERRKLSLRNFEKALKEITPSSSESLGTLADLRKWNEEFGEGRKDKRGRQVWGKGVFGFIDKSNKVVEGGRVAALQDASR